MSGRVVLTNTNTSAVDCFCGHEDAGEVATAMNRRVRHLSSALAAEVVLCCTGASCVQGQSAVPLASNWRDVWSPLGAIAQLPRAEPVRAVEQPDLLREPHRRVGLFWFAANPAALRNDVTENRAEFQAGLLDVHGGYRRPLDAGRELHRLASGYARGALGPNGAGVGRVVVDRSSLDEGVFADVVRPYTTEPYAVLDTLGEPTAGTSLLVEGAGGWRLGPLSYGVALGHASSDVRTVESAVPRVMRLSTTGLTAGTVVEVLRGRLWVGPYGRWQQTAESASIYSVAATSRVYALSGYQDPLQINLIGGLFSRRFERNARAAGVAASAGVGSVLLVAYGQRERLSASNFDQTATAAPEDRWIARGWSAGAAMQTPLLSDRATLTVDGHLTTISGDAEQAGIEGIPFAAKESQLTVTADLRCELAAGMESALLLGATRAERDRSDALAEVSSTIVTWHPSAALEFVRWFGERVAVAVAAATMEHNPSGTLPLAARMGPVYRNWIAPELEFEATASSSWAGATTLRWQLRPSTAIWLQAQYARNSPLQQGTPRLPNAPTGDRSTLVALVGVVLGGR